MTGPRFSIERAGPQGRREVLRSGYESGGHAFADLMRIMAGEFGRYYLVKEYRGCRSVKEYVSRPRAGANGSAAAHGVEGV